MKVMSIGSMYAPALNKANQTKFGGVYIDRGCKEEHYAMNEDRSYDRYDGYAHVYTCSRGYYPFIDESNAEIKSAVEPEESRVVHKNGDVEVVRKYTSVKSTIPYMEYEWKMLSPEQQKTVIDTLDRIERSKY